MIFHLKRQSQMKIEKREDEESLRINMQNHKRRVWRVIPAILLVIIGFLFTTDSTVHANILNLPKLDVVSDGGVSIGPEYTFVPKVTKDTKMETFGSNLWRNTTWSSSDKRVFRSIELTNPTNRDNLKGKIGVRYTNVGHHEGQAVDLKITVVDWSRYGNAGKVGTAARIGNISFEQNSIAMSTQGYSWVDTKWEYVKTGTNTPVKVSGYFTFSDVDISQGIQFSKQTSNDIDRFIITNRNSKLKYKNVNGQYQIYDTTNTDVNDKVYNQDYAFTFLYSDLNSFDIRWSTDWTKSIRNGRLVDKDRYLYADTTNRAVGEYLFFVVNKPVRTTVPQPTKKVNITDNFKVNQKLTYTIEHAVPQEDTKFFYDSYIMTDTLDKALTNPKITVRNGAGDNVTGNFLTAVSGNKITVSAKANTLKSSSFYGETYSIEIVGEVHKANLENAAGGNNSYTFKNKASIQTIGGTYTSNEVQTKIHRRTLTVRHIDEDTGKVITTSSQKLFDGESYSVKPETSLKGGPNNDLYKPLANSSNAKSGTISGKDVTLDFYYTLPRDLIINHIDDETDKLITSETRKMYDGETYDIKPRTDLKRGAFNYKPRSTTPEKGTINKKNVTLNFYYFVPKMSVGLETIEIVTYKASEDEKDGLPTNIHLGSEMSNNGSKLDDFAGGKVKLVITDTDAGKDVYNQTVDIKDFSEIIETALRTDYLSKDKKVPYDFKLTIADKGTHNYELVTNTPSVKTHGYTASEKALTNSELSNGQLDYTGVVKTEKHVNTDVKEYKEQFTLTVPTLERQKTGYGIEAELKAVYTNDLKNLTDVKGRFLIDEETIDSYLDYASTGGMVQMPMDQTDRKEDANGTRVTTTLALPQVHMEQRTGYLFTEEQVAANDDRIEYDLIDGGRSIYLPVWLDLGDYTYGFQSEAPIGVNLVTYDVTNVLEVYAYMFSHMDSDTPADDELLLHPIAQEDIPSDW